MNKIDFYTNLYYLSLGICECVCACLCVYASIPRNRTVKDRYRKSKGFKRIEEIRET